MSESERLSDLTVWNFRTALEVIGKAVEQSNWVHAIEKCDRGITEATDSRYMKWRNKFYNLKQKIIELKKKEKDMDSTKRKVIIPRLEEKKEELEMQDLEMLEDVSVSPEQEEMGNVDLSIIKGVGSTTELKLKEAGIVSISQLASTVPEDLAQVNGFGLSSSERIIQAAKEYFEQHNKTPISNNNKSTVKAPMFDPKFRINRSSRSISPLKQTQNDSSEVTEPLIEKALNLESVEEIEVEAEDFAEPELSSISEEEENENQEEIKKSDEVINSSEQKELYNITDQLKPPEKQNTYSSQMTQGRKLEKNEVINGFLDDTLDVPKKTTPEIKYEQVIQDITSEITNERLNKNNVTTILKKVQDTLQTAQYFIIPKASPVFKKLNRNADCIAIKVLPGNNDTELILIIPFKICDLKGNLLISDDGFDYHSEDNPDLLEKSKAMLVRSVMKDFIPVRSLLFDSVTNDKNVFTFFRNYLKDGNISIEKSRNNQALFFRSGLLQYKIIIEPILVCHSPPASLEKDVLFPFQKSTNIHYTDYTKLLSLITFMEHKYQALEFHCIEGNKVKIYFQTKVKFIDDVRTYSIPFVIFGLVFLLIMLLQVSFLINTFIGLGSAAICLFGVMLTYLYIRFTKTKNDISKEFNNPYHQGLGDIDDTELFMISKDLSTEQMDQFIYECFGKDANFKIMPQIEEDKYTSITAQKKARTLGKSHPNSSLFPKNTFTKDNNDHSKYGLFLED